MGMLLLKDIILMPIYLAPKFCIWMNEFFICNGFSTYTGLNETIEQFSFPKTTNKESTPTGGGIELTPKRG